MATIKEGYASRPFEIRVSPPYDGERGSAEVWTEMFDGTKASNYEVTGDDLNSDKFRTEVLHYATISELIQLRDEINNTIKVIAGV